MTTANKTLKSQKKARKVTRGDQRTSVECVCPRCGVKHKLSFYWSGRGTPKKYCIVCKNTISSFDPSESCTLPSLGKNMDPNGILQLI